MEERVSREVTVSIEEITRRFQVIHWPKLPTNVRSAMVNMFKAVGMDLNFCKLPECGHPVVKKNYCCDKHSDLDYKARKATEAAQT